MKLIHRAQSGQSIENQFDAKQCHWADEFKIYNKKTKKIWRLWLGGVVRIYFCYGADKSIVVAWPIRKREDSLTEKEKCELRAVFGEFFEAQDKSKIKYIMMDER